MGKRTNSIEAKEIMLYLSFFTGALARSSRNQNGVRQPHESVVMSRFRERDIRRAIRSVESAGKQAAAVEIDVDGKIIIVIGKPGDGNNTTATTTNGANEWDRV
jgi:hypothetical protein